MTSHCIPLPVINEEQKRKSVKVKGNVFLVQAMKEYGGVEVELLSFFIPALDGSGYGNTTLCL